MPSTLNVNNIVRLVQVTLCVLALTLLSGCVQNAAQTGRLRSPDETVLLYPEGQNGVSSTPGSLGPLHSNGLTGPETYNGNGFIANVGDSARVELFFPKTPNGQMLLVCPGGGYSQLNALACGTMAGNWLSDRGFTVAVLKYRMPEGDMRVPERDVQNAMLFCRAKAGEWGVRQIGILGGSAGGHLAALSLYHYETELSRPDFAVLLYPLTTLRNPAAEPGILGRMFGPSYTQANLDEYSAELHASKDFPPVFIAANRHDWLLTQDNYTGYYTALAECGADVEMHLYGEGVHGWAFTAPEYCVALNADNSGVWGLQDPPGTEYSDQLGGCRKGFETDLLAFLDRVKDDKKYLDPSLPIPERVEDLLGRMTTDEKISLLRTLAPPIPRLGIDKYFHGNEALHGVVRPGRFTVFPQAIALGSLWDPDLVEQISTAISDEARGRWNSLEGGRAQMLAYGDLLTFWSPTVNLARDPRWGRTPETYGEDPFLSGKTGAAFVRGMQGDDPHYLKVVSTPKHFSANNEEHNRFECKVTASEKILREYYLAPFEACIREGHAASIMAAYNAINGIPCSCNEWLLTDVLRKDWGFDGYVVSDCGGVAQIWSGHGYAADLKESAALAIKAGLDLECGDSAFMEPLEEAVAEGLVTMEELDRAVSRVLTSRMRLGLFDPAEVNPYSSLTEDVVGCEKHRDLALEAARKSAVLLKNDGILPLDKGSLKKIAVLGINASKCELGDYSGIPTIQPVSILQGIKDKVGDSAEVLTAPWIAFDSGMSLIEPESFEGGVKAEYYNGITFDEKTLERTEPWIYFEPDNQAPDPQQPVHHMSARWTADIRADIDGEYHFMLDVFGMACKMWMDGELVVSRWGGPDSDNTFTRKLRRGQICHVVVETCHERDYCYAKLLWAKPSSDEVTKAGLMGEALDAAAASDVVVAVMGYNKGIEREGHDRDILTLPEDQTEFLKSIYRVNKNVVLVLVAGSSIALGWEDENLPAILDAWYGGEYAGPAVADILFGDCNPSGKLPLTFYRSADQLPAFDDYAVTNGRTYKYFKGDPLYPFGYGLSYTDFEYSGLDVKRAGDGYDVKFKVKNTGDRAGEEVAQVYVKMDDFEGAAPIKELKGFTRVSLEPGSGRNVSVHIPDSTLRWWSEEDGAFRYSKKTPHIFVGSSSADIRLEK